ncbi:MAG: endonuclease/exonuclease/phosphatase family protein [Cyclobacteriaceae bacterium]
MIRTLILFTISLPLCIGNLLNAQERPLGHIAFYNVENLFDIDDDPEIRDDDFTPAGELKWDTVKYADKIMKLGKVFSAMAVPDIIGLSEIENRKVLEALVSGKQMSRYNYQIVHFDSPDRRGIDVALLYRQNKFTPFFSQNIAFEDPSDPEFKTRDILHVKGLYHGDTLNIFVNHWPSRRGGKEEKRIMAAKLLRKTVDGLLTDNPEAKIVIMGDLNDDPSNKSVRKNLLAHDKVKKMMPSDLYNTSAKTFKQGYGTLFYRGTWNLFDQIIISQSMLSGKSGTWFYKPDSFRVFAPEWMRVKDGDYAGAPFRTFVSGKYQNGYSDHYPVFIEISK